MTLTGPSLLSSADGVGRGALEIRDVRKTYGRSSAPAVGGVSLAIEPGQFVTLLGPSGCGKTTTLRMIAGFETPSAGDILVDGRSILGVAPNRRPMSMVFQSYALFPHLTVEENVAFGLRIRREARAQRATKVADVMAMMGIEQYAARYPHELSGGQQQRVALARAIVMEPSILLFDEPLSNLDARLRLRMREEIRSIQRRLGITSVFVTHDQSEAMTMSDVVVVMRDGRIEQTGTPEEVYHRPETLFVASFLGGANVVAVRTGAVTSGPGENERGAEVAIGTATMRVPGDTGVRADAPAHLIVRSENLSVATTGTGWRGRIVSSLFDGAIIRYTVDTEVGVLHAQTGGTESKFAEGTAVVCGFAQDDAWLIGGR